MSKSKYSAHTGEKGFTLIELLIVIGILAVVAAIAVPNLVRFSGRGKGEAYDSDQNTLQTLVNTYRVTFGCMPTANGIGGDKDSGYIVFTGYIGNVDAQGNPQQATNQLASGVQASGKYIVLQDVDGANNQFMVGHWIHIAALGPGSQAEDAVIETVDVITNTIGLMDKLTYSHDLGAAVTTNKQGFSDTGQMVNSAPKSSLAVTNAGGDNVNGGLNGSYRWYCDANGGVQTDPPKDKNVYP